MEPRIFIIPSDFGCMALLNPDTYQSFLDEEFSCEALMERCVEQNAERTIVAWGCAYGNWRIEVRSTPCPAPGISSFRTAITTGGRLVFSNYEELIDAAMNQDATYPFAESENWTLSLPAGTYEVTVTRHFTRATAESPEVSDQTGPHYTIALIPTENPTSEVDWFPWAPTNDEDDDDV